MKISEALITKFSCTIEKYECPKTKLVKAVEVQDLTKLDQKQRWDNYLSYGHEGDNNTLWIYSGGQIKTQQSGENVYHHTVWDPESLKSSFYGRATQVDGKTVVTMNRPWRGFDPDSESTVKRLLYNQFSPDQIKVFG